ncbi:MAG: hypothetical protein SCH98_04200 [Deferrisomatales bacterium]|nr:hypothetical protein [Deferrisomatales bacterium]
MDDKMVLIQEKIGDGLKTGSLTPDQSQMYLTTLKGIRTDAEALRGKTLYEEKWKGVHGRLDALGAEIDREAARAPKGDEQRTGDRMLGLQRKIDDGRASGRLRPKEGKEFQARLDSIRVDHSRMIEGGRYPTSEERAEIVRRMDSLERDLAAR